MTPRALRVGVLLRENLVEERVFVGTEAITIGQSLRCRLSVPADGMPHEHVLFSVDQGRLLLRLAKGMSGRLAQGGTVRTELLEGAGDRGVWTLPIERGARGRLQIGEATLLFQEVAAPTVTPRPMLPASVRGTLADRIDRRLAVIIGASLIAHIGIATWAWTADRETDPANPYEARVYKPDVTVIDFPDEPPPTEASTGPGTAAPVAPVQTPAPIVRPSQITQPVRHDTLPTPVDPNAYAQILTGNTGGPAGSAEMRSRQPGADLDKQIHDVTSNGRTVRTDRTSRDGGPRIGTTPRSTTFETGPIEHVARPDELPPVQIVPFPVPKPKPDEEITPTAEQVLAKIKGGYMSAIQRCYAKGLTLDGSLRGKIKLSFTIDERGHVADPSAGGLSSEVDQCVTSLMPEWIFPAPRNKRGEATEKAFKLGLVFQPSN